MSQDQWFIGGTHPVGKGEVACSNHAGSTIAPNLIACNPSRKARRKLWLRRCIIAGFVSFALFLCFISAGMGNKKHNFNTVEEAPHALQRVPSVYR